MGLIRIENMEFYAFHGHYREEKVIGNRFLVDLQVEADLEKAAATDNLEDTLNYAMIYKVVSDQMSIKSDLLEHVAGRILDGLYQNFNGIRNAMVTVSKMNPPLGGQIERVSVTLGR